MMIRAIKANFCITVIIAIILSFAGCSENKTNSDMGINLEANIDVGESPQVSSNDIQDDNSDIETEQATEDSEQVEDEYSYIAPVNAFCGAYNCAIVNPVGDLFEAGRNKYNLLGFSGNDSSSYIKVMSGVEKAVLGIWDIGVLKRNGDYYVWGDSLYLEEPTKMLENVKDASIYNETFAAVTDDGTLYLWGDARQDLCIHLLSEWEPVKVLDNVSSVSLGGDGYGESMAYITNDGLLYTVGRNDGGCLGNGSTENTSTPQLIMDNVKSVSVGSGHMVAVTNNGELYAWGKNSRGQLGNGTNNNQIVPTKIMDNIAVAYAGDSVTTALDINGTVYSWGSNYQGGLGLGSSDDSYYVTTPTEVMSGAVAISSYERSSLVVLDNGDLYGFGSNNYGKMGIGDTNDRYSPSYITNITTIDGMDSQEADRIAKELEVTEQTVINTDISGADTTTTVNIAFKGLEYFLDDVDNDHDIAVYYSDGRRLYKVKYEAEKAPSWSRISEYDTSGSSPVFYGGKKGEALFSVSDDTLHVECDFSDFSFYYDDLQYISVCVQKGHIWFTKTYSVENDNLTYISDQLLEEYLAL